MASPENDAAEEAAPAPALDELPQAPAPRPRPTGRRRSALAWRLGFTACALLAAAIGATLAMLRWLESPLLAGAIAFALIAPLTFYAIRRQLGPATSLFRALAGTATSYRDGDFAISLAWPENDELGDLVAAHNELGDTLRQQRQSLVQRELLLDTMLHNTPVAMLLCNSAGRIVYGNLVARKLLHGGRRLEGQALATLVADGPEALREAIARGGDGLFIIDGGGSEGGDEEETYYLARRGFRLNGRVHELFVLRQLTSELRRQEVRTWKKVIRVISHELNNSLAPIASLAHSGAELLRRGQHQRLEQVFATIGERARHLEGFIRGYASFAKLPTPRLESVAWPAFLETLRSQVGFELDGPLPTGEGRFDRAQIEQALLNLLRNAHESESLPEEIRVRVRRVAAGAGQAAFAIEVSDRGTGMNEAVLANALLPFYSTKRGGTGLGLALVREIAEAHGGRVGLANRDGGGLTVSVVLPA